MSNVPFHFPYLIAFKAIETSWHIGNLFKYPTEGKINNIV